MRLMYDKIVLKEICIKLIESYSLESILQLSLIFLILINLF